MEHYPCSTIYCIVDDIIKVMEFVETNHRNPSKYRAEERNYYNFVKMSRKMRNTWGMKEEKLRLFEG